MEAGALGLNVEEEINRIKKRIEEIEKVLDELRSEILMAEAVTGRRIIEERNGYMLIDTGNPMQPYAVVTPEGETYYYMKLSYAREVFERLAGGK